MMILIDMNLPPKLATALSQKGIQAEHWYGIGAPGASDMEIMDYARIGNYIVLTCDLDFTAMLSITQGRKPSLIQVRSHGLSIDKLADLLVSAIMQNEDSLKIGAILTIDPKRARVRLLPLKSGNN